MVNPYAGEVALVVNGEQKVLKLTLAALVELEEALGADSLVELVERFEDGRYRTRDVLALVAAGLRGGGLKDDAATIGNAEIDGGPIEAARVAARLLARAFAMPGVGQ